MSNADDVDVMVRLERTASAATGWLLDRIAADGAPAGSDVANTWWRVPWALAASGELDRANQVLSWVERTALTGDGDLLPGPIGGERPETPVYQLSHIAIAAFLLQRWDTAERVYGKVLEFRQPGTGGIRSRRDPSEDEQDWLLTAQLGLLATAAGDSEVAGETLAWFERVWQAQPALDELKLHTRWRNGALVTGDITPGPGFIDFKQPQHYYFQPGGAAAFLAGHGAREGLAAPVELAREMLDLNLRGTAAQFDDPSSVHICKFGWGVAQMLMVDPAVDWTPHAIRMADWFADRQDDDGAWAPSAFTMDRPPTDLDRMWKTAEHLMEVRQISSALAARTHEGVWRPPVGASLS